MVSADVPPERKPEREYIRQNHPFTKPPFYLPVSLVSTPRRQSGWGRLLEPVGALTLISSFPCFFGIPCLCLPFQGIPCFFQRFSVFPRDFRGRLRIKNPCFFGGFPCRFQKSKERKIRIQGRGFFITFLARQKRTIAIASIFCVDGAKSPEIRQKMGFRT